MVQERGGENITYLPCMYDAWILTSERETERERESERDREGVRLDGWT